MKTKLVITSNEALIGERSNIDPKHIADKVSHLKRKKELRHFSDIGEFQKAVKVAEKDSIAFYSNSTRSYELDYLIKKSVDNTTFRSLPLKRKGSKRRPSDIYREYTNNLLKNKCEEFQSISKLETYSEFVKCAAKELANIFDGEVKELGFLGFGRAAKMLNLSFKFALMHRCFSVDRNRLVSYLHVPLDRYTLQGIRLLAVDFNIPANASMGWAALNNEDTYNEIQNWVRKECSDIGCYPIHYEFALWDMRGWHEKQLARGIMITPNVDRCSR